MKEIIELSERPRWIDFEHNDSIIRMNYFISPLFTGTEENIGEILVNDYLERVDKEDDDHRLMYWHVYETHVYEKEAQKDWSIRRLFGYKLDKIPWHTSAIRGICVDKEKSEVHILTFNNLYRCKMEYCNIPLQNLFPHVIPRYKRLRSVYKSKYPSIGAGKVLLVLGDFCEHRFHSLYYKQKEENTNSVSYTALPHLGMFQDSFHIEAGKIRLSYFPGRHSIEFYHVSLQNKPLFIENIGDNLIEICFQFKEDSVSLEPGERKEIPEDLLDIILIRGRYDDQ